MRYWYDLIWHYVSSNSRHGTHSPFVYKLADEVIYNKENSCHAKETSGIDNLIEAMHSFFQQEIGGNISCLDIHSVTLEEILSLYEVSSVIFLKNIYDCKESKVKWSALRADQNILVTIDLFYFGVVFCRKEQPKENFKLRFPYK